MLLAGKVMSTTQKSLMSPASPSETKLLAKTVALAQLLATRTVVTRAMNNSNCSARLCLLFASFLQVARALGVAEKVLDLTDRYLELLRLLSYFSFSQSIELLCDARWVLVVQQKMFQVKTKKFLMRWRVVTTDKIRRQKLHPEVKMKSIANYRTDFDSVMLKPILKRDHSNPLAEAFHRWQISFRAKRVMGCQAVEVAQHVLYVWRKWAALRNIFVGRGFENNNDRALSQIAAQGPRPLARFIFREWRGNAKLQRRRIRDLINDKRKVLDGWRNLATKRINHLKLACLYDQTRNARPSFCAWLSIYTKLSFADERARIQNRKRIQENAIDLWRSRRKILVRGNHFLGRWRSSLDYHRRQKVNADNFYVRKLAVKALQKWRTRVIVNNTLRKSSQEFINRRMKRSALLFLNVWREVTRWVARSSERVRTLRANRDARFCFGKWRQWRETRQAADSLCKANLARRIVFAWKDRVAFVRANKDLKESVLENWRRLLQTKIQVCHFIRIRSEAKFNIPRNFNWAATLLNGVKYAVFAGWLKTAVLNRRAEMYEARKNQALKSDVMKSWRMDANVAFYLRQ